MKPKFGAAMRRALLSTRAQNLRAATETIQDAIGLRNSRGSRSERASTSPDANQPAALGLRDARTGKHDQPGAAEQAAQSNDRAAGDSVRTSGRVRRPLREVLAALKQGRLSVGLPSLRGMDLPGIDLPGLRPSARPQIPPGAQFVGRSFSCAAGSRDYKLYIPASAPARPSGLIVMLHGCKQNPDDFACGTNMNAVAEAHGMLVAYPTQPATANPSSCWNWFSPYDQRRGAGEPSIIAGITREIAEEFRLARDQIFIAGLSAGGAMAAIMAETYPDLYAAVGIHSGLAYGSANDVVAAFAAMRGEKGTRVAADPRLESEPVVRAIVFQGTADTTVHPSNAEEIVAAASLKSGGSVKRDHVFETRRWTATKTILADADGRDVIEYWLVDGIGHAWLGGDPSGSYTDSRGPNASAEMVRFFLDQPA